MSNAIVIIAIIIIAIIAVCLLGMSIARKRRALQPPPLGIVLLLSRTTPLEASALASIFSRVTGTTFQVIAPSADRKVTPADIPVGNAVLGTSPSFLVTVENELFLVNNVEKPYMVDLKAANYEIESARLAELLKKHEAWLSVEILHPEAVSSANYRMVGQVCAELLSAECLALLHPESRQVVSVLPSDTLQKLRTPHPINAIFGVEFGLS